MAKGWQRVAAALTAHRRPGRSRPQGTTLDTPARHAEALSCQPSQAAAYGKKGCALRRVLCPTLLLPKVAMLHRSPKVGKEGDWMSPCVLTSSVRPPSSRTAKRWGMAVRPPSWSALGQRVSLLLRQRSSCVYVCASITWQRQGYCVLCLACWGECALVSVRRAVHTSSSFGTVPQSSRRKSTSEQCCVCEEKCCVTMRGELHR